MNKSFKPTVNWMAEKYDEMNAKLFGGQLGQCDFNIFTSGRGSQGRTLGFFRMNGRGLKIEIATRKMFRHDDWFPNDKEYVNKSNFYSVCRPSIELNGNYSGTEHAFLGTLVHEMCHYYTYMNGYAPKQGHGTEFRNIAYRVSYKSNGEFSIQRLASAEEMQNFELSDEMKAKQEKRLSNKKASLMAIFVYNINGTVKLSTTSSQALANRIIDSYKKLDVPKVVVSNDLRLIELLYSHGYRRNFRTWRYWNVGNTDWIKTIDNYDIKVYNNPNMNFIKNTYGDKSNIGVEAPQRFSKRIFSIKTNNGTFKTEVTSESDLFNKLRERFPKMSDETIKKIMSNQANYQMTENKRKSLSDIIKEAIEEAIGNDGTVDIDSNMNLGLHSPLEGI